MRGKSVNCLSWKAFSELRLSNVRQCCIRCCVEVLADAQINLAMRSRRLQTALQAWGQLDARFGRYLDFVPLLKVPIGYVQRWFLSAPRQ